MSDAKLIEEARELANELADVHTPTLVEFKLRELATALAAATTENTQLRSAINRAGFGVMKTSGDWLICDVSKAGEAEREKTAEIIIRNIELEKEIAAATERELGMREAMSGAVRMLHAAGYKMEGTISDKIRESFPELFTKDNK